MPRILGFVSRGPFPSIHLSQMRDIDGQEMTEPDLASDFEAQMPVDDEAAVFNKQRNQLAVLPHMGGQFAAFFTRMIAGCKGRRTKIGNRGEVHCYRRLFVELHSCNKPLHGSGSCDPQRGFPSLELWG